MTGSLPAAPAESREAGAPDAGLLPRAFAVFIALHGLVHDDRRFICPATARRRTMRPP
jgi:hypothetical protein